MLNSINKLSLFSRYKSSFYQKSLTLKNDFSMYKKQYKQWHPEYFDVNRRTQYQKKKRDYNNLVLNTQDQLFFDYSRSDINGGFERLLSHLKKDAHLAEFSISKIGFIMYNMAYSNIMDNEFFDELDSQINLTIVNANTLFIRTIYGLLYAYYKFNRGKAENIYYLEKSLETDPSLMHIEMSLPLFELANKTTIIDKDRLNTNFYSFYKPNFIDNWNNHITYKQRLATEFLRILPEYRVIDDEIWKMLIKSTFEYSRINNLDNYNVMLKGLSWYNSYPESPLYNKLGKRIEEFKSRIKIDENRAWKYDVNKMEYRTYSDMFAEREEIDDKYIFTHDSGKKKKADVKVIEEKKELSEEEVRQIVAEKIANKESFLKIKIYLSEEKDVQEDMMNKIFIEFIKTQQNKLVDDLKKKNKFVLDMTDEERKKMEDSLKVVPTAKGAPGAKGAPAGKKDDGKKKK